MKRKHVKVYDAGENFMDRYTVAVGFGREQQFFAIWQGGGTSSVGAASDGYHCGRHLGRRLWMLEPWLQRELDAYLDETAYCSEGFTYYTAVLHDCRAANKR